MQKIAIIWLWYVWFPLLCAIAKSWKYTTCWFDVSSKLIDKIRNWICPIDDELAKDDMKIVKFEVSEKPEILSDSDIFIVCVPTPIDEQYNPDFWPIIWACNYILPFMKPWCSVIIESTINPWVCEEVVLPILQSTWMTWGVDFELAHCPERINPGDQKWNVYNINRNIWALTKEWCKRLADVYRSFLQAEVNETNTIKEAEATKIIENTFRDINIAYVNELAKSFDKLWIDLINVIKWASNKPFAFMAHYPGCGVWGHCIAVDPYYLIERAKKAWFDHKFLRTARMVNNSMPEYTIEKLVHALNKVNKSVKWTKLWLMWLSYKRDISDLRESPALKIKEMLIKEYESDLRIFEPYNLDISTHKDIDSFLADCEAVIIATDHTIFKQLPIEKRKHLQVIVDGRNCLDKHALMDMGVLYTWIGR